MARPNTFNRETFDRICERMAGGETLREICRDDLMPPESTVRRWAVMDDPPGISAQYGRAREAMAEHWADETLVIADDGSNDWMERRLKDGSIETVIDREHVARSTLRVSQRNWLLGRLLRDKYGDKIQAEHTGKNGGPIATVNLNTSDPVEAAAAYRKMMNET